MSDARQKYIGLLTFELKDLRDDIEALIVDSQDRMEHSEISKYVCFENIAIFKNEVIGIEHVAALLGEIDPDNYAGLDEMIEDIKQRFWKKLQEYGFPEAPRKLIQRKLEKVARYVRDE